MKKKTKFYQFFFLQSYICKKNFKNFEFLNNNLKKILIFSRKEKLRKKQQNFERVRIRVSVTSGAKKCYFSFALYYCWYVLLLTAFPFLDQEVTILGCKMRSHSQKPRVCQNGSRYDHQKLFWCILSKIILPLKNI